jgi:hypothetical protein
VLGVEVVPFIGLGRQLVEFGNLPLQPLALALQAVLGRLRVLQRLPGLAPAGPAGLDFAAVNACIGIQQGTGRIGPREALPGMLAMDVDELLAQGAQLRGRGRRAVDPCAAAALDVHRAPQQQATVFAGQACGLQPGADLCAAVELHADVGLGAALAHHVGIGAGAQGQLQGIDQDGFAGAGLPGQHGEARLPVQVQGLHDHEVAQHDALERHGQAPPSFQPSFLRSVAK